MNDIPPAGRKWLALAAAAVVALVGLGVAWAWWRGRGSGGPGGGTVRVEPVDPRLTYSTPYRNVRPDVEYVGDKACAGCHASESRSYRHHPMGQALAPVAEATPIERFGAAARNPLDVAGLRYAVRREGERVFHRESAGEGLVETEAEVHFALGSGARARSYVIERDGYLFQSPLTWYPQGGRWDLSPSYEVKNQHFSRPVMAGCLFCHCNHANHVPGTANRYRPPIFHGHAVGCERCHGPGELHVKRRKAHEVVDGLDDTIVNPARLGHALREAVCEQCHLQAEQRVVCRGRSDFDYRPGLPLHLFLMDFMDGRQGAGESRFVSSVEQMRASRCYDASREPDKLGCISCHDPHRHPAPEEKVAHYRGRCLRCHTEASCSLPPAQRREKQKDDSCVACHMPRTGSDVNHTSVTDHRIPRNAGAAGAAPPPRSTPGPSDLVAFHRDLIDPGDEELSRNLGLAVMAMLDRGPPDEVKRQYAEKALPLLERALARDAEDLPACEARADALWCLGRREEALAGYDTVLSHRPESETALHRAGSLALELNRPEAARSYLERAVGMNPWRWPYHFGLATASFRRGEWGRAVGECREALRLEPTNSATRSLLIQCYLGAGERDDALAEYETLRRLTPEDRREGLRRWFEGRLRQFLGPRALP
jgi:Tfp pilus assembly protein PilF